MDSFLKRHHLTIILIILMLLYTASYLALRVSSVIMHTDSVMNYEKYGKSHIVAARWTIDQPWQAVINVLYAPCHFAEELVHN